jgi:hypothetical protein
VDAAASKTIETMKFQSILAIVLSTLSAGAQNGTIRDQVSHNRAVEAVIWGIPAVNFDMMYQATVRDAKGGYNSVVYWPKLQDWHIQTLTPNPDVIYFSAFFNLKQSGPMVLAVPPAAGGAINGTVMDCWQNALEDVGVAGVDKGKGAKYLIVPPDFKGITPGGYILMRSDTYQGYFLLRSVLGGNGSDAEIAKAVGYGRQIRFYPYSQAGSPPATAFIDMSGKLFDATIPYDLGFFRSLDRMVQIEPWLVRDKAMIDPLKSIGIEKGKSFEPDARMQETLNAAVADAHAWLADAYEHGLMPYFHGEHWALPLQSETAKGMTTFFSDPNSYPIDGRGVAYYFAYFSPKHMGAGQFYLITIRDKAGDFLEGGKTYRLSVPAHAPVKQYWSATVYDRETHALIRDARVLSRSSQTEGLQVNPDGSADLYFGPAPPSGKKPNWVATADGKRFEVLFRFYGPEKPLFDKTWRLPDIEEVK